MNASKTLARAVPLMAIRPVSDGSCAGCMLPLSETTPGVILQSRVQGRVLCVDCLSGIEGNSLIYAALDVLRNYVAKKKSQSV